MSDSLKRLRELTHKLPHSPLIDFVESAGNFMVSYAVDDGTCSGVGLLNRENIAVQVCEISKGAEFPKHFHEAVEILIVISGELCIKYVGSEKMSTVKDRESHTIPQGVLHSVVAVEETVLIGITMPRAEGYPDGPTL